MTEKIAKTTQVLRYLTGRKELMDSHKAHFVEAFTTHPAHALSYVYSPVTIAAWTQAIEDVLSAQGGGAEAMVSRLQQLTEKWRVPNSTSKLMDLMDTKLHEVHLEMLHEIQQLMR